jgi:regulator of sigma E protease
MGFIYYWYYYLIIGTILIFGKAITCRIAGIQHHHYQIGYSPCLFSFTAFNVKISIGIIIPFPWLFKIYEVHNNEKLIPTPIWRKREFSFAKRFFGMTGGVILLYLIAMVLFCFYDYSTKHPYLTVENVNKNGLYPDKLGVELGFRTGDKLISIEGKSVDRFDEFAKAIVIDDARHFTVDRNDSILEIIIANDDYINKILYNHSSVCSPIQAKAPIIIKSITPNSNAEVAGLTNGDKIVAVNNNAIYCVEELQVTLNNHANEYVTLEIISEKGQTPKNIDVLVDQNGKIGFYFDPTLEYTYEKKRLSQSLFAGNYFITQYLKQLKNILFFKKVETKKAVGFSRIGNLFPQPFWKILALVLVSYIGLLIIPTPISDTRNVLALLIDQFIKLPPNAGRWLGWIFILVLIVLTSIADVLKVLSP